MVDLDALTALDALQWLRTCEEVSKRFGLSQATVGRQSRRCLDLFGLDLQRIEGEWNTIGDAISLSMEVSGGELVRLPLELPFPSGVVLVCRRDFIDHPRLLSLLNLLHARLAGYIRCLLVVIYAETERFHFFRYVQSSVFAFLRQNKSGL